MTRRKKTFSDSLSLLSPIGVASDRQTTNSIQPTDERASCQCERVITPTKRRERGETERDRAAAAQHRRRRVHVDVGLRLRVGQLDVFIKMEQGVRAVCVCVRRRDGELMFEMKNRKTMDGQ